MLSREPKLTWQEVCYVILLMLKESSSKLLFLFSLITVTSESTLFNQCYSSGTTCIRFEKSDFQFVDSVQLTSDNVPTLKDNSSTTSTRIVLSELLSHLAFNHSWTLAALVVNAGTRTNVQWKIAPDEKSEHLIEIQDPDGYGSQFSNVTVHCVDIQNYADDAKRLLVVPPDYRFFFSTNGTYTNCSSSGLSLIPIVWDAASRASIRGMSYFSQTSCTDTCSTLAIPSLLVRFCPNFNSSNLEIQIDQSEDFTVELSDDLLGINFQRVNKSIEFPIGLLNCTILMENADILGENPVCLGDGENIAVKFGSNPKMALRQEVKTKFSPRTSFLKNAKNALSTNNVILVTGCNVAGKCTSSGPIRTELVDDASVFSVSIDGIEQETPASFGLRLHANPTFKQCSSKTSPKDVQYEWKLNGEGQMFDDGIKLPAYSFSVDELVNITLVARYNHEKTYSSSTTKTIHYFGLPLLVTLDCVERQIGKDHDLLIRVLAVDQNSKDSSLKYQWSCSIINGSLGPQSCNLGDVNTQEEHINIPNSKLTQNTIMNLTAKVSSGDQSDSSSCLVNVGPSQIPTVMFYRLAERKHYAFDFIRIQAMVSSSYPTLNITWEIVRDSQFGFFNITSFLASPTTIIKNVPTKSDVFVSLTIPPSGTQIAAWPGLMSGKTFVIRLWATNEKGSSFADLHLLTNAPPTIGNIDVSTGNSSEECGERVGITAILSVCDRLGSCSYEESGMFAIDQSVNSSLAALDLISLLNTDVVNGNFISAIAKINALNIELCTENYDQSQTDKITMLLFQSLSESRFIAINRQLIQIVYSESEEFQESLKAAYSLLPVVSSETLSALIPVLSSYRQLTFQGGVTTETTRRKRSAEVMETTSKIYKATESEVSYKIEICPNSFKFKANDMLKVYDILIGKDKPVVDVFFLNINDFLTGFCVQLDEDSKRYMSATGGGYTEIQTQTVNANRDGYNGKFNISGPNNMSNISFSAYFTSSYSSWTCGLSSSSTCRYVCLGTAWISNSAISDNTYLAEALFLNYLDLTINKSVSDLHQLSLVDPISGTILTPSNGQFLYSVDIEVNNYKPINYYNCYIYNQNSGWDFRQCIPSNYAKSVQGHNFLTCNCSSTGIIGVFLVNGPAPDPLSDHNEILLTLVIDVDVTADDLSKIFTRIATLSEVDQRRFVKISNRGNRTIKATLRPPTRSDQKSNGMAIQSIQKAIGYQKILNVISVLNFTYSIVKRDLNGDAFARKVTFKLLKNYESQLGPDVDDFAKKWAQSMAAALQISEYRFKNYKIFFGMVYNVTITLPFADELKPLSAEEISLMIQECTKYGEFDFQIADESVQVGAIADSDLTMLKVLHETNALMLALAVVLSIVLGLGTVFICGAVLVKLRTDKLIVEERRRANLNEHQFQLPPPPQYPVNTTPFHVVDQYPLRRQKTEVRQF
uniref:REJ domain-containing protein n=1 Tax=Caenorhabditis tropicalis TaxID=1561998 RepID=A0A1I7U112_9PELO